MAVIENKEFDIERLSIVRDMFIFSCYTGLSYIDIKKHLTFHTARHTIATTVTLSNWVPIEKISKMLGHTKIATTQIYARVLEQKISNDMNVLKTKLNRKPTN